MKQISIRLSLACLTFILGISFTVFWLLDSELPDLPPLKSEELRASSFTFDSRISKQEKRFWEKELLPRFKELPLEKLSDSVDETYRFVLLPTFDAPIVVRIWRSGDRHFLITKKTNGLGSFGMDKFGKLSYEKERSLTAEEWNGFIKLLDESLFWDMLSKDKNDLIVEDGALWIIEGVNNKVYHEVKRITPNKEFQESCNYLLRLSGFENEYEGYNGL